MADEPLERYRLRQEPWSPTQVIDYITRAERRTLDAAELVIQEHIAPAVAGASLSCAGFLLSEGIAGPAAPLLRDGVAGDMVASWGSDVRWRRRCGALDAQMQDLLALAHSSIPTTQDALWEWIVDDSGAVYHVDRKPLSRSFLATLPDRDPPSRWKLGRGTPSDPVVELDRTSIEYIGDVRPGLRLVIATGSPLAHLCFEAVSQGCQVDLAASGLATLRRSWKATHAVRGR